jgi:hypothetical protein
MAALIKAQLVAIPIGTAPLSSNITQTCQPDGSTETMCTPAMGPVFMDPTMADVIANAVAAGVIAHILSAGVVVGFGGGVPGPVTGKLT